MDATTRFGFDEHLPLPEPTDSLHTPEPLHNV